MPAFQVVTFNRDFTPAEPLPGVELKATRWSHHCIGGPRQAVIDASGVASSIWTTLDLLRCPVRILDMQDGTPLWWGFINEVHITTPGIGVGVTLDNMENSVYGTYSTFVTGAGTITAEGVRGTVGPYTNAKSIALYGTKEGRATLTGATAAQATAAAQMRLNNRALPIPTISTGGEIKAQIGARGWWATADWQFYTDTSAAIIDTVAQIQNIVTASCQFLTACRPITATSGITSIRAREGDNKASRLIEDLCNTGTTASRRLTALVTVDRVLEVREELASGYPNTYHMDEHGYVRDSYHNEVPFSRVTAGYWIEYMGIIPYNVVPSLLTSISPLYVEEVEYDARSDKVAWRGRDNDSGRDLLRVR